MIQYIKEKIIRLRTWIVNVLFTVILAPDIIMILLGADWGSIIPEPYINYVTFIIPLVNVLMRPWPAVIATDPEVRIAKALQEEEPVEHA